MCNTFDRCRRSRRRRRRCLNVTLSLMTATKIYDIKNAECVCKDRGDRCVVFWRTCVRTIVLWVRIAYKLESG